MIYVEYKNGESLTLNKLKPAHPLLALYQVTNVDNIKTLKIVGPCRRWYKFTHQMWDGINLEQRTILYGVEAVQFVKHLQGRCRYCSNRGQIKSQRDGLLYCWAHIWDSKEDDYTLAEMRECVVFFLAYKSKMQAAQAMMDDDYNLIFTQTIDRFGEVFNTSCPENQADNTCFSRIPSLSPRGEWFINGANE